MADGCIIFNALFLLGLAGIVVMLAFLLAATFTLLYNKLSSRLNVRLLTLMLIAWGAGATSLNWAVRPHLVSMLLLAVWLIWADELRRGEKIPVWRFPVLMLYGVICTENSSQVFLSCWRLP